MTKCSHEICGKEEMVWLPVTELNNYSVEKHPWCTCCGLVKNISEDRARGLGYWMNLLSSVANHYGLTRCQKRLIAKEIEASDHFDDKFGMYGSFQKINFKKIVKKYSNKNIDSFVY